MTKVLRSRMMHPTGKPVVLDPVWPNAGVQMWYQSQLDMMLTEMYWDARKVVLPLVAETPTVFAKDEAEKPPNAAGVIFVAPNNRVLLLKRNDTYAQWGWPGGGIEKYETPEAAMRREVKEELQYDFIGGTNLLHVQHFKHVRFATFVAFVDQFQPQLNHEHTDYIWISPQSALKILPLHPGVRVTLQDWLNNLGTIDDLASDASTPVTRLSKEIDKWGRKWIAKFDLMSKKLSLDFANRNGQATQASMMSAFKKAGFTVAFRPTPAAINAYQLVAKAQVSLIKNLPQQFYTQIQTHVWDSIKRGGDLHTLSKKLEQQYGIERRRAALIARDQNAKSKEVIEDARLRELGLRQGIWMHSHAGKEPRPTHVKFGAEHKLYELGKGIYDPDPTVQKYVLPGELINCRCTKRVYIPGFDAIRPEWGLVQT